MTVADRPGTSAFGYRYAPASYSDAEKCAWSGGYWAHQRRRYKNPFRVDDSRHDAWEAGWEHREWKVLYGGS